MLDPKGIEAACAATVLGEDECEKPVHLEPREAETAIRAYLSTITPAEVGGHADAQTEARAIQRYIAPSAGRGAVVQLLKHCDGEWVRYEDHATALAAKDAELAELREADGNFWEAIARAERAEAQLAEANKARNYLKDAVTVGLSDSEISRRAKLFIAACEAQGGE